MKIIIAEKTSSDTYTQLAINQKVAGLNIDDCRIDFQSEADLKSATFGKQTDIRGNNYNTNKPSNGNVLAEKVEANPLGRYPANIILEQAVTKFLDKQSGNRKGMSGGGALDKKKKDSWVIQPFNRQLVKKAWLRGDSGGASRFFKVFER